MRMVLVLILFLNAQLMLHAATADEILAKAKAEVPKEAWIDLGSTAWAEALQKELSNHSDLAGEDLIKVQLALSEAWLAAGQVKLAASSMKALSEAQLEQPYLDRYGSNLILQWTLSWRNAEKEDVIVAAPKMLKQAGNFSKLIRSRSHVAEAARLVAIDQAKKSLIQYDAAYALLKGASIEERITVLQLRLTAMETAGMRQTAIADWFDRRKKDDAVKAMATSMFNESQSMVGKKLVLKPDVLAEDKAGEDGEVVGVAFDFTQVTKKARILFVFATWSKGSMDSAPVLAKALADYKDQIDVVGISLDTEESIKNIDPFLARYGLDIFVSKNPKAWESERAKQLHLEALPTIILLDKKGIIRATDIHGADAAATQKRLKQSLEEVLQGKAAPVFEDDGDEEDFIP